MTERRNAVIEGFAKAVVSTMVDEEGPLGDNGGLREPAAQNDVVRNCADRLPGTRRH